MVIRTAKIYDSYRFLKYLTIRKLLNWLAIYLSFLWSRWSRKPIHWGDSPSSIAIEPTTACNLRCPECPSGLRSFTRATGNLKTDFFRKTLVEVSPYVMNLTFYFQGEPYINPNFLDMVRFAHDHHVYTTTSTNGHFLDETNCRKTIESGLDRLIISIDGATQETYQQYRREGHLETVLDGTRRLIRMKHEMKSQHPYIVFQFLVVAPNEHEMGDVIQLANDLGVDEVKFKTAQLYDYQNGHELMPSNETYSRYRQHKDGHYELKNKLTNECWKLWHSGVITWNGHFVPCCFDKDAQHIFGDLKLSTFSEVWKGQRAKAFRKNIMTGRKNIDICQNCSEGCRVWAPME